ncbi:hypothetical protein XELAEV_18032812mg [Xenopus laevis]|uniref:Beta/gamma crystallin 'Greek key' domain-containing protein n=2 Tax=Xenopus laevis TaxID=8355 RepID=A0A974HDD8_XENLA|nr:hypothetical protein XELAEV_18032812mg [Xenopus laevis]
MLNPPIAASLSLRPRESSPCLNCHIYGGIQVFSPVTLVGSWFGLASVQQENMSQYSGKIIFYEGKCFTGRKLEVFGDCDNFQDRGFMNRVNSIRVETGAWICYDHPDFKGQQYILERGEYPDLHRWNGHNDHMGSCRPVRMHGERYRLELFEGCNFTGQCMEFHEDCPYLQGRGWNKNCVNACKVYGDGAWMLYEEPNYRGRMYIVERGDYRSFNEWQSQNANIQSVRRVVNYF